MTTTDRWRIVSGRAVKHSLVVWPPLVLAYLVFVSVRDNAVAFDFAHAYVPAARKLLHGLSPYPPETVRALAPRTAFIYPPLTAWLAVPFAAVPLSVAEVAATCLMVAAVIATLLLLEVRDWRCYMVALLWLPTYSAIQTANLALPTIAVVAALWRYRDRPVPAGILAGTLIALKLYFWPLGLWLIATRRYRAAGAAAISAIVLTFVSWAPIGFVGLSGYPNLLRMVTQIERGDGYTIAALLNPTLSWGLGIWKNADR